MTALQFIEKTLGYLLYNFRGHDDELIANLADFKNVPHTIKVSSSDFGDNEHMPTFSSAVSEDKSPNLSWSPEGGEAEIASYAVVLQDLDPPIPHAVTHMIVYGVSPSITGFQKGELNSAGELTTERFNFGYAFRNRVGYHGPRPVLNHGPHRYVFQVFGLNKTATEALEKAPTPNLKQFLETVKGQVSSLGLLTGVYERKA